MTKIKNKRNVRHLVPAPDRAAANPNVKADEMVIGGPLSIKALLPIALYVLKHKT